MQGPASPGATSTRVKKMMWLMLSTLTILVYMLGLQLWFVNRAMLPLMVVSITVFSSAAM